MADLITLVSTFDGTTLDAQFTGSASQAGGEVNTVSSPIVSVATYTVGNPSALVVQIGAAGWVGDPNKVFVGAENASGTRVGLGTTGGQDRWRLMLFDAAYDLIGGIASGTTGNRWAMLEFLGADANFYTSPTGAPGSWVLDHPAPASNWAADHFNGRKIRLAQAPYSQIGIPSAGGGLSAAALAYYYKAHRSVQGI
jgi:hypothetical protein